jgi:hypothetical protein
VDHKGARGGRRRGGLWGRKPSYREVSLVDPQEEDQLGQAQGSCEVAADAMLVGAQCAKKSEEEEGEQQGGQGDTKGHICQCLQRQYLPILQGGWQEALSTQPSTWAPTHSSTAAPHRSHLPPGHIHEHSEARHVVTLAADVALIAEDNFTPPGRPATCAADPA